MMIREEAAQGGGRTWTLKVAADAARIWTALTDERESAAWYFGTGVRSDWSAGSAYAYLFPDETVAIRGRIIAVEPERRLEMTFAAQWSDDVAGDPPSRVIWSIEEHGRSCTVTVEHVGVSPGSATEAETTSGWPGLLASLKTHIEESPDRNA